MNKIEPTYETMVLITYSNSVGSDKQVHSHSLARTFAVRTCEVWELTKYQTS